MEGIIVGVLMGVFLVLACLTLLEIVKQETDKDGE